MMQAKRTKERRIGINQGSVLSMGYKAPLAKDHMFCPLFETWGPPTLDPTFIGGKSDGDPQLWAISTQNIHNFSTNCI